jgi:hypothetical protein
MPKKPVYGKRLASSPKESMPKKGSGQCHEADLDTLVKIELESINGKPYLGQATDDELLYIWVEVFKRSMSELFGLTSTKSLTRNVRATFKLHAPTKLTDIAKTAEFYYEKYLDDGSCEKISGRILGHGQKPAELGDTVKVSVKTGFHVLPSSVVNWLKNYGAIIKHDFATNLCGLKTDTYEVELVLRKHIEEFLPMYGQKVVVSYPGMPKMCNRCYLSGHLRRECNNRKRDWIAYVIDLVENQAINEELIGSWKNAVQRWKSANQNVNPSRESPEATKTASNRD